MKKARIRFELLAQREWGDCGRFGDWDHVATCMYAASWLFDECNDDLFDDALFLREIAIMHEIETPGGGGL